MKNENTSKTLLRNRVASMLKKVTPAIIRVVILFMTFSLFAQEEEVPSAENHMKPSLPPPMDFGANSKLRGLGKNLRTPDKNPSNFIANTTNNPLPSSPPQPMLKEMERPEPAQVNEGEPIISNLKTQDAVVTRVENCVPRPANVTSDFSFANEELINVIQYISKITCKNFIVSQRTRSQRITIISKKPVNSATAYEAFLSSLEVNDLTVVPAGKYLKINQSKDAAKSTIPLYGSGEKFSTDDAMITKLFPIEYGDLDTITNVLKQLVSASATIIPYAPTNTLIINETGMNMVRVEKILQQLDVSGGSDEVHVLPIKYSNAEEVVEKLNQLFDIKKAGAGAGAKKIRSKGDGGTLSVDVSKLIADERTNKIIIIGPKSSFDKLKQIVDLLDVPVGDVGQIHVYRLGNAKATELATTLSNLATKSGVSSSKKKGQDAVLFEGEVKVTADKDTNSLVIVASPRDYRNLVKVIARLDIARRQVYVEAIIMEVSVEHSRELGMALHSGFISKTSEGNAPGIIGTQFPSKSGTPLNSVVMSPASLSSLLGFIGGIKGPAVEGTDDFFPGGLPSFGAVLHALQSNSDVNVLSTPHMLTLDNEKAKIEVGEKRRFSAGVNFGSFASALAGSGSTGSSGLNLGGLGGLTSSFNTEKVGLELEIKPQINQSDTIRMEIELKSDDIAGVDSLTNQPIISRREAKTAVVVDDQQTVVIGGMIRDRVTESESKIPFLGDIPIIGMFFRNKEFASNKTNLLLVLTPYIIRDSNDFRTIFEKKMKERDEFVKKFYGDAENFKENIEYLKKIGPFNHMHKAYEDEKKKIENGGTGLDDEMLIAPQTDFGSDIPHGDGSNSGNNNPIEIPQGQNPPNQETPSEQQDERPLPPDLNLPPNENLESPEGLPPPEPPAGDNPIPEGESE